MIVHTSGKLNQLKRLSPGWTTYCVGILKCQAVFITARLDYHNRRGCTKKNLDKRLFYVII